MIDPLPEKLPIFPLPNVVLFPGALLPLHVFEPRYLKMTEDALRADRAIGMVLLRPSVESDVDPPSVFPVGCLGRIVRARSLDDGRYLIVLRGDRRFRIASELPSGLPYRLVVPAPLDDLDPLPPEKQEQLERERQLLQSAFLELVGRTDPGSLPKLRSRLHEASALDFVHTVAFSLDLSPVEKQSVLETEDPVERARTVRLLLEFRRAELGLGLIPRSPN